jgi:ABC-2 type transport system permease protein
MLNLFWHEMRIRRTAIIGWGIGMLIYCAVYIGSYPQFADQFADLDISSIPIYQAMGISMTTLEGYLSSTVFQFMAVVISIYAVVNGTGTLAGEEDQGSLENVIALPLPRWQVVTAKALAVAVALLLILIIAGVGAAAIFMSFESDIETELTAAQIFSAVMKSYPFVLAVAMISLFLAAYLPNRRMAAMVSAVVLIASFFGSNLASLVDALEPLRPFSLFYYVDTSTAVFTDIAWGNVAALLGVAAVAFALALWAFQRRNVTVGAWPWQRATVQ